MSTFQDALKTFLARKENAEAELAGKVGCSQAAINRYRRGARFPDAQTARQIDEQTGGEVPFEAWKADFLTRSGLDAAA